MRAPKLQPGISSKWQVTHKLPKFTSCNTSALSSHMLNTRSRNPRLSQGLHKTKTQIKGKQATTRRPLTTEVHSNINIDVENVEIPLTWKVLLALKMKYQCKSSHKFGHFTSLCFMKSQQKQAYHKHHKPKAHQLTAGMIQTYDSQPDSEGSDHSFCLQLQVKGVHAQTNLDKKPTCLITNLSYWLKMHENRNLYLQAKLDTCANVNIMPASVYKLVFKDPSMEKLIPNKFQIGTYTNDTVKVIGTCKLYLVHLDTKKLLETIFYVATNDGSVL